MPIDRTEKYRKGRPLTYSEFQDLKIGDVVYCTYREYGEDSFRVDGAYEVSRFLSEGGVFLDDETIGAVEFHADPDRPDHASEDCCGEGESHLYVARKETPEDIRRDRQIAELKRQLAELEYGG